MSLNKTLFAIGLLGLFFAVEGRLVSLHGEREEIKDFQSGKDTFCAAPVAKGKVNFPDSLAGRAKINFDMYSGYVNVTSAPDYLFYWFFAAQNNPDTAPLIIWTNGGPGCTAMEGATTEHGPLSLFDIKESCSNGGSTSKCDYTLQLSKNTYSWNVNANVLYLDQPRNVGYSFGYGTGSKSSVDAAQDFLVFYQNWLTLFPEFVGRKLIISGESYGGHYIPAWAGAIIDYNSQLTNQADAIPLSAVVIGNGCVNNTIQDINTYVEFQHQENLIPASSNPRNQAAAQSAMVSNLGYTPNYYDYRLESVTCSACYSYNYTAWSLWFLRSEVLTSLNVCGDAGVDAFAGSAGGCISMGSFDANDKFDYSGALAKALNLGIPVTVYYGKTDTACQYVGGQALADTISWNGQSAYKSSPYSPWVIAGIEAGQIKSAGGLTYIGVEGAGHMVPMDQPAASAAVIQSVLASI